MKALSAALILLQLAASIVIAQEQIPMHELLDAKYRTQQGTSRITFAFSEPPRFLHKKLNANQVRLTFPGTTSEKYADCVPLIYKSGCAKRLSFDFSRTDTIAVIVTLADKVAYDVRKVQSSSQIIIEMYSSDTTKAGVPLVNIKALAQQQIEEASKRAREIQNASSQSFFDIQMIPFIAACFISLLGTAGMMYWIVKPPPPQKPAPEKALKPVVKEQSGVDAILAQAKLILQEKAGIAQPKFAYDGFSSGSEDPSLALAKKFGRRPGEFRLARSLEMGNNKYKLETKLHQLDTIRPGQESVARAKKLGVGKGELDLAVSLKRIGQIQLQKESVQ